MSDRKHRNKCSLGITRLDRIGIEAVRRLLVTKLIVDEFEIG